MMLSLACVSIESVCLPSIVMGDCGVVQCYGLSIRWNGGHDWIPAGVVVSHAQI
jgi:hypothetical protein